MSTESKICQELYKIIDSMMDDKNIADAYISPSSIIEKFTELYPDILVKLEEDTKYAIFNYGIGADFTNPVIQEARGIIIDMNSLNVVCWPFRKFGKYNEPFADDIDWKSACVQEKVDGSIIKLWFDKIESKWVFSTNSMIRAEEAAVDKKTGKTFMDLIKETPEFDILNRDRFTITVSKFPIRYQYGIEGTIINPRSTTFIFELVSPDNRVVVPYSEPHLIHIGTRNNKTGREYDVMIDGIRKPKIYHLDNLDECIDMVSKLNMNKNHKLGNIEYEGFVVVDKNYNRVKIKSPDYMTLHSLATNNIQSKRHLIDLLYHDMIDFDGISRNYPELAHIIFYYKYQLEDILYEARAMIDVTKRLSFIFNNRKDIATRISSCRMSPMGFMYLNNPDRTVDDIINQFYNNGKILKMIPDYDGPNFVDCFRDL